MRKLILLVMMMAMAITSQALNYDLARREALFLSDKMAYELGLTEGQLNAVYEINLDYFLSVGREDAYGIWWRQRNYEMQNVLLSHGAMAVGASVSTDAIMTAAITTVHAQMSI